MENNNKRLMPRIYSHTVYLLVITAASIFVAEVLVMIFLSKLPPLSPFKIALLDASILTVIIFPALFLFLFRPLKLNSMRQEQLILKLEDAFLKIKTLDGLIPICAWCKKIRNDKGYWDRVEAYVEAHTQAKFTHSICPKCAEKFFSDA